MKAGELFKLSQVTVTHNPGLGLDLVRIYLGIGLLIRGILFVAHPEILVNYLRSSQHWVMPLAISHYVVAAHICGGILLALGLGTRVASLLQMPPLIGALLFVHFGEGLLSAGQSLEFAGLVLALLIVFSVFGAGKFSLDHVLRRQELELEEGELIASAESANPTLPAVGTSAR